MDPDCLTTPMTVVSSAVFKVPLIVMAIGLPVSSVVVAVRVSEGIPL